MQSTDYGALSGKVRVGVSACLLGDKVRFDGGHKRNALVNDVLAQAFELIAFCPEVAIGLGTPREPIYLVGSDDNPKAVGAMHPQLDVTQPLRAYGRMVATTHADLCGFILKSNSPSCGMQRVQVYRDKEMPSSMMGIGLFAHELMKALPLLPVEEEARLSDAVLRENFISRVYAYAAGGY